MNTAVIQDQVDAQILRNNLVDMPQEADEIDAAVAAFDLADDLASGDIQSREPRSCAMASIVVGARLRRPVVQRQ